MDARRLHFDALVFVASRRLAGGGEFFLQPSASLQRVQTAEGVRLAQLGDGLVELVVARLRPGDDRLASFFPSVELFVDVRHQFGLLEVGIEDWQIAVIDSF